jgi:hypothetical protein
MYVSQCCKASLMMMEINETPHYVCAICCRAANLYATVDELVNPETNDGDVQ